MTGKSAKAAIIPVGALAVLAVIGLASCGGTGNAPAAEAPATTTTAPTTTAAPATTTTAPTTTAAPVATTTTTGAAAGMEEMPDIVANGVYEVGVDWQPGRHRFATSGSCYWERLAGFSGEMDDVIADGDNTLLFVVDVAADDVGFRIDCRDGDTFLSAGQYVGITPDTDITGFMNGVLEVGADKDIAPGRYRFTGSCYWARLSGFSGEMDDLIANGNEDGSFIVEIDPADAGFELQC